MSSAKVIASSKAKALYQNGYLVEAIKELIQEVRNDPGNNWLRTFLFELLCFNGEWERAERQLKGLSIIGAKAETGLLVYNNNIKAEIQRHKLFSNDITPKFLSTPPNYVSLQLTALTKLREKNYPETRNLLDNIALNQPNLKGKLNGKKFSSFVDYNDFFGNCLEVFLEDKYYWLPFENIQRLEIQPPKFLRDLVWIKAVVQLTNDTLAEVFLPTLYPNSYKHENELVRLGRMTDWQTLPNDIYLGYGLRTFLSDNKEKTILEVNELTFDHS
ncbi:MAG: hypothetical protein HY819_24210 [Acidobacteria bacterium]|nr:hypothetical protein [Acidobacteriota bacterium]